MTRDEFDRAIILLKLGQEVTIDGITSCYSYKAINNILHCMNLRHPSLSGVYSMLGYNLSEQEDLDLIWTIFQDVKYRAID